MSVHTLVERLKQADQEAACHVRALLALEQPEIETAYPHVRGYIFAKFLLSDEDPAAGDIIRDLAAASMARMLDISEGDLAITDLSDRCAAAPSVETKIVLVIMRLEAALQIKLEVMERVESRTMLQLSEKICRHLRNKRM